MEKNIPTTIEKESSPVPDAGQIIRNVAAKYKLEWWRKISKEQGLDTRMGQHASDALRTMAHLIDANMPKEEGVRETVKLSARKISENQKEDKDSNKPEADTTLQEHEDIVRMHETLADELANTLEDRGETIVYDWAHKSAQQLMRSYTEADTRNRMTQLYTRRELLRRSSEALAHAEKNNETLVFFNIDADMFKAWNDAFGHIVGDVVLQIIAFEMHEFINKQQKGVASRVGGEELTGMFVIPEGEMLNEREVDDLKVRIAKRLSAFIDTLQKEVGDTFDVREKLMQTLFSVRKAEANEVIRQNEQYEQWLQKVKGAGISVTQGRGEASPSEIYKRISSKINTSNDDSKINELKKMQRELAVLLPLGTVTVGLTQVDCSKTDYPLSEQDTQLLNSRINSKDTTRTISKSAVREVFSDEEIDIVEKNGDTLIEINSEGITYIDLRKRINERLQQLKNKIIVTNRELTDPSITHAYQNALRDKIHNLTLEHVAWQGVLDSVMQARVGRMMEHADVVQETQKKIQRNTVSIEEPISVEQFDKGNVDLESRGKPSEYADIHDAVQRSVRESDQELRLQLDAMQEDVIDDIKDNDPRLALWERHMRYVLNSFANNKAYDRVVRVKTLSGDTEEVNLRDFVLRVIKSEMDIVKQSFISNLPDKYLDSLLNSPNDTYKEGILPNIVKRAYKRIKSIEKDEEGQPETQEQAHFSVVSFDFDNLKAINEVAGHAFGDTVLRLAAVEFKRLSSHGVQLIRPSGGEEFILIVDGKTEDQTKQLVEKTAKVASEKVRNLLESIKVGDKSVYNLVQEYIRDKNGRRGKELDKIGTITAAIIDIANTEKVMTADELVRQADEYGEFMKRYEPDASEQPGQTLRGHTLTGEEVKKLMEKTAQH